MSPGGALNNLGVSLIKEGRFEQAIAVLEEALTVQPSYLRALTNLGKAMRAAGRLPEAIDRLREATALEPDYAPALVNLGDALAASGDLDAAEECLERALCTAPGLVEAHMTLGIVRLQSGRVPEAIGALRNAVALAPAHADAHQNLAHALFVSGDWQAAWPHFEYRFQRPSYASQSRMPADFPRWDGLPSAGLELWLIAEQGLGDQLQFARYAKTVADVGVRCVIACHPRIVKILAAAQIAQDVIPLGTARSGDHVRIMPLMSLPAWHGTQPETVPASDGYLVSDESRVRLWSGRLASLSGLRVALAWAGNPAMETGRYLGRSPPLSALAPLMSVHNVSFVSVQKYTGEHQLNDVSFGNSILQLPDLDSGPDAFLDTAAVLKSVDMLITSDTSIAHLGGALGVPTWLCLMHEPDWRWMRSGSTTPWYTSMRLFRQPSPGDWDSVFVDVANALQNEPRTTNSTRQSPR
jgi:Flp pilus assembly protein TadD